MFQSVILGIGVAMATGLAIAVAVKYFAESHYSNRRIVHQSRDPDITNVPALGDCSFCTGAADALNGYQLPCNHPIHYTCSTYIRGILRDSPMLCKICLSSNPRDLMEEGSNDEGNRESRFRKCVNCHRDIRRNSQTLPCSHEVHQECWHRMQENSTPCASCHEDH